MTTPGGQLNRLITVQGSSTTTLPGPFQFPFPAFGATYSHTLEGWAAGTATTPLTALPATVAGLEDVTRVAVETPTSAPTFPQAPEGEGRLYVYNADRVELASWERLAVADIDDPLNNRVGSLFTVTDFQTLRADDALVAADVHLGFEEFQSQVVETHRVSKRAWARQLERGAGGGLFSLATDDDDDTVTATTEEAEFVTRYDPQIAVGSVITDDLGRNWSIFSSKATDDRRYLIFTCQRSIVRDPAGA